MSSDFVLKIRKEYRMLRPSEQKVADRIIDGDLDPTELTIEALAEKAGVSQPTVIRFARAMGLSRNNGKKSQPGGKRKTGVL